LILSWNTPIIPEADNILYALNIESLIKCDAKIGRSNKYYGNEYNMVVSGDSGLVNFDLVQIK